MPTELKTGWKRIGRSGATIDGRKIDPVALTQAAANYDKTLFSAVINYEHSSWANLGTVEALKAESNEEGGVDLFATLSPNDYYLSLNKDGQKVFTSMELNLDFRETGEAYLTGLAATDRPASAGTTQMRFSKTEHQQGIVITDYFDDNLNTNQDEQAPSWFTKFFKKPAEEDMDKKQLEALQAKFTTLSEQINAFMSSENTPNTKREGEHTSEFATAAQVTELTEKLSQLEAKLAGDANSETDVKFAALQTAFDDLSTQFKSAIEEQPGTDAGEHDGDGEDLSAYV